MKPHSVLSEQLKKARAMPSSPHIQGARRSYFP
jgi:hypothetical protein